MIPPPTITVTPRSLLDAVAAEVPGPPPAPPGPPSAGRYTARLLVGRWLADRGVAFRVKPAPDARGRTVYVLDACPFDATHADPDACVMQAPDGKLSAQCFHDSCRGRGWQAFKAALGAPDPHHYDPPLTHRRKRGPRSESAPPPGPGARPADDPVGGPGDRPTVTIDPEHLPVADTLRQITDRLLAAADCFRRADQVVRIHDDGITPVLAAAELAGLLNHHAEVLVVADGTSEFKPLPAAYANTWLHHPGQAPRLLAITLFTHNPVYTADDRLTPPGYDPASGIYYAGPPVAPRDGTAHLDRLLRDFCFRTPGDRTNYLGMLLTALLVPRFIGSKPAVLFNGNQPGLGKSVLAQLVAVLRDGRPSETATYNPNDEEFEKRLGAIVRRGATTIIIDNAKGRGRNPRIESACLERSITDPILSFRLLGYSREIRAENAHLFCLTANTPDVSRDLVTRSVVVNLYYEGDPTRRTFTLADPEEYAQTHRVELLGELLGWVERWRAAGQPRAAVASRFNKKGWGPIIGGVLETAGQADFLANASAAAEQLDETRREFAALAAVLADHPQGTWTASQLAELALSEGLFPNEFPTASPRGRCTIMGQIASRYIDERFVIDAEREAVFRQRAERKRMVYSVAVQDRCRSE